MFFLKKHFAILQLWDLGTDVGVDRRSDSWNFSYNSHNTYYTLQRGSDESLSLLRVKWGFTPRKVRLYSGETSTPQTPSKYGTFDG